MYITKVHSSIAMVCYSNKQAPRSLGGFEGSAVGECRIFKLILWGRDLNRGISFGQFDALAVLGGRNQGGHLDKDTEHQEFAYSGEDRAIDDAHWRKQEAPYDEQEANCKCQVEDFHGELAIAMALFFNWTRAVGY